MLKLSQACGLTNAALVYYFRDMDNIIQQSAELALKQTEEVFVEEVTRSVADLEEMLLTFSHRIAERCGAKLRFVY